ncbi:MAG TPA: GNAT family N-acetyltransferase [Vicinamibacteria bacterium]|nr:GNAT family N-acetyltransferase [Vicinamibacteria bacterium]
MSRLTTEAFTLAPLEASMAEAFWGMTFPVYRHLLSLRPSPRHPEQGDDRPIQPTGFVARAGGEPVGLALAELPLGSSEASPEVLSLFVRLESRNRGVGTALLDRLQTHVRERGFAELRAVFMGNRPGNDALLRVLAKLGWSAPEVRTVTLRFSPRGARNCPWYGRVKLSHEYEIFPWTALLPREREELQRSQAEAPWIPAGLVPWEHDFHSFDPVSSLGLRYRGQVVGWVINHRVPPATVRFTCSFMRKDLGRRGRILPLYTASLERLEAAGCTDCLFITPMMFETMVDFVRNRCAPWEGVLTETYGVSKRLV